jgi:flagellar motor switch protein FliM
MSRPLDASHFKTLGRTPLSSSPGAVKLAKLLEASCGKALERLRNVPWQTMFEAIDDNAQLPAEPSGRHVRLESEFGSLTANLLLDRPAVSAVIEAAMGGTGAEDAFNMNDRPLSKIETRLIAQLENSLARELAAALTAHLSLNVSLFDGEDQPEITAASGELVQFRYLINVFSYSGEIRLMFPAAELERQLKSAESKLSEQTDIVLQKQLQEEVNKSDIALTVTLGAEILSLEEISGLRPGRLIELSSTVSSPVTIWSGSVAAFQGRLARNGDRLAVAISTVMS